MYNKIETMLQKHLEEAEAYTVADTAPSALRRGEGTLRDYYIFKIDLCASTHFLARREHSTYLRLVHTYLSTVDQITQQFGAESSQVEYAGDGIIAYFPCDTVDAVDVLRAAYYCRYAAMQMKGRHSNFRGYEFNTKIVLHKAELILAKIGPWGGTRVTAIGRGLHFACKMESCVPAGEGRASLDFGKAVGRRFSRFLAGDYEEELVPVIPSTPPPQRTLMKPSGFGLGAALAQPTTVPNSLLAQFQVPPRPRSIADMASVLYDNPTSAVATPALPMERRTKMVRHKVAWGVIQAVECGRMKL
ncbi:adenylate/guanylate cyclase domain-containing protein [Geomonas oryzae]|uniref:adenylate/guanylate cyclase domain-containing protein n=1 Tax=Geomonas oryzae TaxID=2364273 RepID=UPI00100AFE07|nr:adenylate/guanylate cyclase domain-containing protein [Geomonas oryzae]